MAKLMAVGYDTEDVSSGWGSMSEMVKILGMFFVVHAGWKTGWMQLNERELFQSRPLKKLLTQSTA